MNVNLYNTTDYERKHDWTLGESKPNSNPIKPNLLKAKMNVNLYVIEDYRKNDDFLVRINKPNLVRRRRIQKMNANVYVIEDYENETAFRPQKNKPKTKPNKPNFFKGQNELKNRLPENLATSANFKVVLYFEWEYYTAYISGRVPGED